MACGCQKNTPQWVVKNAEGQTVFTGAEVAAKAVAARYPGGSVAPVGQATADTAAPDPAPAQS